MLYPKDPSIDADEVRSAMRAAIERLRKKFANAEETPLQPAPDESDPPADAVNRTRSI